MTGPTPPDILLPFSDDSTLFFAQAMRALLAPLPCRTRLALLTEGAALSPRQLAALPHGPDLTLNGGDLAGGSGGDLAGGSGGDLTGRSGGDLASGPALAGVDAIVTARMFPPLQALLGYDGPDAPLRPVSRPPARPVVVSFQGGLDFTPERGFAHRHAADAVFVVPRGQVAACRTWRRRVGAGPQIVDFGHPAFLAPQILQRDVAQALEPPRDIYFFAQAISPLTRASRRHIVEVLAALARRHPDRTVWIKLRHLPGENADHLHRERHDYPGLLAGLADAPPNLALTACPMAEAMAGAARGITCTSTAAADLVQAGVPTQIYVDYVENYLDPLMPPMRRLFGASGLVASLDEVLHGVVRAPDPDWLADMFCPRDLGERVLAAIAAARGSAG